MIHVRVIVSWRRNSEQVMAVAIATLSDSEVALPIGKFGMNNLWVIYCAALLLIPLPSLPITISPLVDKGSR